MGQEKLHLGLIGRCKRSTTGINEGCSERCPNCSCAFCENDTIADPDIKSDSWSYGLIDDLADAEP